MKTLRIIMSMLIAVLVFSVWTPATASAKAGSDQTILVTSLNSGFDIPKVAYVTVENRTGGLLYVQLTALQYAKEPRRKSYFFAFPNQGKIRFQILPGRFTYTIRSSNCAGRKIDTKFFTGETDLGAYHCDGIKK